MAGDRFHGRITAIAFAIALVTLLLVGVLSYHSTNQFIQAAQSRNRAHRILETLESLMGETTDAETGQRGYLITGKDAYLEPYEAAIRQMDRTGLELPRLTADDPSARAQLEALQPLIAAKSAELRRTIQLRREQGFEAAQQVVLTDQRIMDDIRQATASLRTREEELIERTDREMAARSRSSAVTLLVGNTLSFALLLSAFVLLTPPRLKSVSGRRNSLKAATRN